ncbi:MAG: hypothetical protein NTY04_01115 [Candidatus Staskawiczbacteria bacterium]|nr:hypothetical protein [Candidatus Staskawiczbacteria bacterium]
MKQETKQCQNCKNKFVVEPEDFNFYEKMKVPAPTFCADCRMQRRLIWRNERTLYKRKCNAPGHTEDLISMYAPEHTFPVYDHEYWYSDNWDSLDYGKDYDFSKPFFKQFEELLLAVPHVALFDSKSFNSNYCNLVVEQKNCYLVSAGWGNEDSMYSNRIAYCKNTLDSYVSHKTEFGYENVYCKESNQLRFSLRSESCVNSYFLYDCRNCSNCICCYNLRNKSYCIFNQQYTKEEYAKKVEELNLGSYKSLQALAEKFKSMKLKAINRFAYLINTQNVIGDNVEDSRNCYHCFDLDGDAENSKYCHWSTRGLKDCYDSGPGAGGSSELLYEGISIGVKNARCKLGAIVWYSHDAQYCYNCQDSHDLFGCVGMRNKQYCIFNKQYTKEGYEKLASKIIEHMNEMSYVDRKGRVYKYGEFFPAEISPFTYNETVAQDYMPLTEKDAMDKGFNWRPISSKNYKETISWKKLPDTIKEVSDSILDEVIGCAHEGKCDDQCTGAFKIVKDELDFYKRMNLPLPRLCPNCRHYGRVRQRNPMKLWHRKCMKSGCTNEFETSYAPDRPEIVYCEGCYQKEVY